MKIEIHNGDDWVIVYVNGEEFHAGHDIPEYIFAKLLNRIPGVEASIPAGNFCTWCGGWTTEKLIPANDGEDKVCPTCKAEEKL